MAIDAKVLRRIPYKPESTRDKLAIMLGNVLSNTFEIHAAENAAASLLDGLLLDLFSEIGKEVQEAAITPEQTYRLRVLIEKMKRRVVDGRSAWVNTATDELTHLFGGIGASQATWVQKGLFEGTGATFSLAKPGLSSAFFRAMVENSPFPDDPSGARVLSKWVEGVGRQVVDKVEGQVRLGMIRGSTTDEIVRAIRGRATGKRTAYRLKSGKLRYVVEFEGGVYGTTTRNAEAIARTATNHVANQAHLTMYRENADILKGVEFVATLDEHTTFECMALDGTVWAVESGEIKAPPRHYRCRSVLVPVVDWDEEGLDFSDVGTKASQFGPVKGSTSYSSWLKGRPAEFQNRVLGKKRADAFRAGSLTLADLVDGDGTVRTLAQLGAMGLLPKKETPKPKPKKAPPKPPPPPPAAASGPGSFRDAEEMVEAMRGVEDELRADLQALDAEIERLDALRGGEPERAMMAARRAFKEAEEKAEALYARMMEELGTPAADVLAKELDEFNSGTLAPLRAKWDDATEAWMAAGNEIAKVRTKRRGLEGTVVERMRALMYQPEAERAALILGKGGSGNVKWTYPKNAPPGDARTGALKVHLRSNFPAVRDGTEELVRLVPAKYLRNAGGSGYAWEAKSLRGHGRAFARGHSVNLSKYDELKTVLHEYAHLIENRNDSVRKATTAWRDARTAGEELVRLKDLFPRSGYKANERTRADGFFSPYVGKVYPHGSTEVLSMGLEAMWEDPLKFWRDDPDHFRLIFDFLRGAL